MIFKVSHTEVVVSHWVSGRGRLCGPSLGLHKLIVVNVAIIIQVILTQDRLHQSWKLIFINVYSLEKEVYTFQLHYTVV